MTGDDLPDLGALSSEARNPRTHELDTLGALDIVRLMNDEDAGVARAVGAVLPEIAQAVDVITERLARGGRLIHLGAGTSGRLGVLDASECPPTFGVPPGLVVGLIAGGDGALRDAIEGAEDDAAAGAQALDAIGCGPADVVVGITASGRTPFVLGAVARARALGAATVGVSCNPGAPLSTACDIAIVPEVGPEVITGSTRLKAGTAQKMVLNMLSTASMVRLGKVYGNLMVDLRATNRKLVARARRIVAEATGCEPTEVARALDAAGGEAKLAIFMLLRGMDDAEAARAHLAHHGGRLRAALASSDGEPRPGRVRLHSRAPL